jgi:plasmid stability protein
MSENKVTPRPEDKPYRAYPDIPPEVHAKLKIRAKKHFRSVRAEITAIIEEAIAQDSEAEKALGNSL